MGELCNGCPDLQQQIIDLENALIDLELTPGPEGPAGVSGYEHVAGPVVELPPLASGGTASTNLECPAGKVVLGGGYQVTGSGENIGALAIFFNGPISETHWVVVVRNISMDDLNRSGI